MELSKVDNLDHLNKILDKTLNEGMHKAIQGKWGARDFVLTDIDDTTTTVKMKDIVQQFHKLAAESKQSEGLIEEISNKIIDIDLMGDVALRERGDYSMLARDLLRGSFSTPHLKNIDTIREKYLYKQIPTDFKKDLINDLKGLRSKEGVINDQQVEKFLKNPYCDQGKFSEQTKLTLKHLMAQKATHDDVNTFILCLQYPSKSVKAQLTDDMKSFVKTLGDEYQVRYERNGRMDKIKENIDSIQLTTQRLLNTKDDSNLNWFYYSSPVSRLALAKLTQEDPGKAFPMLSKLTMDSADLSKVTRKDEIIDSRKLYQHCKGLLLRRVKEYGNTYKIDLKGEPYVIEYHFDKELSKKELNMFFDLKAGCDISHRGNLTTSAVTTTVRLNSEALSKIMGIDKSLIGEVLTKKNWE